MIVSTFWLPKDAKMSDWMRAADDANRFGERTRKAGIQLGFHNHDFEFHRIDGDLIYDKLMGEFDPQLVKSQFQVSVISLGYQAADYFEKYPGRFLSIHLQDRSPTEKKEVALGRGIVDWKRLWAAAKKSGAKNYFVEVDRADLRESVQFLKGLS
jgi:sugar phosphate isomerase/epimerase